jgi:hypothetical protein
VSADLNIALVLTFSKNRFRNSYRISVSVFLFVFRMFDKDSECTEVELSVTT